jgi:hypothetical protein
MSFLRMGVRQTKVRDGKRTAPAGQPTGALRASKNQPNRPVM